METFRFYLGHGMIWSFIIFNIIIISEFVAKLIGIVTEKTLQILLTYILTGTTAYVGYKFILPKNETKS